jgi:hypothetical protein
MIEHFAEEALPRDKQTLLFQTFTNSTQNFLNYHSKTCSRLHILWGDMKEICETCQRLLHSKLFSQLSKTNIKVFWLKNSIKNLV